MGCCCSRSRKQAAGPPGAEAAPRPAGKDPARFTEDVSAARGRTAQTDTTQRSDKPAGLPQPSPTAQSAKPAASSSSGTDLEYQDWLRAQKTRFSEKTEPTQPVSEEVRAGEYGPRGAPAQNSAVRSGPARLPGARPCPGRGHPGYGWMLASNKACTQSGRTRTL